MRTDSHAQPVVCPTSAVAVPKSPTVEQMAHARDRLLDLVRDFPFLDEVDRSVWFAGLMTGVLRGQFDGPAPLFFIEGQRGTGKTLLASITSWLITGRPASFLRAWPTDEQARIALDAVARNRTPMAVLDNVAGPFATAPLASFLTCALWHSRQLGSSQVHRVAPKTVWWATGASVRPLASGDLGRRLVRIRLDAERQERMAHELRVPNLHQHVIEHLHEYLVHITTLRNGFTEHARSHPVAPAPWGAFEGWSNTVRALVIFAGLPDPHHEVY